MEPWTTDMRRLQKCRVFRLHHESVKDRNAIVRLKKELHVLETFDEATPEDFPGVLEGVIKS